MKKEVSTDRLIADTKRVLDNPFWIPTLKTDEFYTRTHDDHDGTHTGKLNVSVDRMGDVWLLVDPPEGFSKTLRFRTYGGGGNSLRVRNALMILAEAIRLDNLERPEPRQPAKAVIDGAIEDGKLAGLRYGLSIIANRRVRKSTPDYLAALDDMELFLQAAIERVENGESMHSEAVTTGTGTLKDF